LIESAQVKDLEGEVETNKQKSKENLQQALLIERERFTQMQWDMEELRRKSMEMELKLKSEQVIYLSTILLFIIILLMICRMILGWRVTYRVGKRKYCSRERRSAAAGVGC